MNKSMDSIEDNDKLVDEKSKKEKIDSKSDNEKNEHVSHDNEEDDEDTKFDHLVPDNWEQLADMRLRMLEKEYTKCI